ncbi:MAG: SapC family protein, partial [bacterium]|nr:SapC family protein [bacterium]
AVGGFLAINRQKLKALPDDKLAELARSDELELAYLHLQSMHHLEAMAGSVPEQTETPATGPQEEAAADSSDGSTSAEEADAGPKQGEERARTAKNN